MNRALLFLVFAVAAITADAQNVVGRDTIRRPDARWNITTVRTTVVKDGVKIWNDTIYKGKEVLGTTETKWNTYEGKKIPEFEVMSESSKRLNSADLKGKTVVISFWLKTCGPCLDELRRVGPEIIDKYPADKFAFIAIGHGENEESAKFFHKHSGATFDLYFDPTGKVMPMFATNGCPKVFVIDSNGIVRYTEHGYNEAKFDTLKKKIKEVFDNSNKK